MLLSKNIISCLILLLFFFFFLKFVSLCSATTLAQPVSLLPPSLFTHHFFLLPVRQWAERCNACNARFGMVTQQFTLGFANNSPPNPSPPGPPSAIIFKQSVLGKGLQTAHRGFTVACLPIRAHNEEKSGLASQQPVPSSRSCTPTVPESERRRERAQCGRGAQGGRAGSSSGDVRMRTGVVFHKAFKVSWQLQPPVFVRRPLRVAGEGSSSLSAALTF